jgi:hypothetical protein
MSTNELKTIDLSTIDLAPVLVAAEVFLDAASDFAETASREKPGPSRALMSLHADAVIQLYILRRRLTEAGLYNLSRRPDRAGAYDGPILRMHGAADDRRLEVCTQADYLRAGVAELWKQVRPFFRERGGEYEFSIDPPEVKRFRFDDSALTRVELSTHRLRAATGPASRNGPAVGGDNLSDNSKKPRKLRPRGPYDAKRQADIVRGVEAKLRKGSSKQQAIEEIADERDEKAAAIKGVYYRAQRERRQTRQRRRGNK